VVNISEQENIIIPQDAHRHRSIEHITKVRLILNPDMTSQRVIEADMKKICDHVKTKKLGAEKTVRESLS
jgi:hypothetical protein